MQCEIDNEFCPFNIVREEIKNNFIHFERVLREIRDRLLGEIEQMQKAWRKDILNLKKVRKMVGQEIPEDSFVSPSRRRLLDSFELEIQLSLETKPIIEIVWNESVRLFELESGTQIAHLIYKIPNQDTGKEHIPSSRSYSNSFTSGFGSNYLDDEATPVSEYNFCFDAVQIKKTHSTSSIQTKERSQYCTHNQGGMFPTYFNQSMYQMIGSSHLKLPCRTYVTQKSRSLPQSPIMGNRSDVNSHGDSQSFDSTSIVQDHNPKQRDIMLLEVEDSYLANSPGYVRLQTVIQNPIYKSKQERSKVSELKKTFENNCQNKEK